MDYQFLNTDSGWFSRSGPLYDVAVSSRVRLARNLHGYRFPDRMSEDEAAVVEQLISSAWVEEGEPQMRRLSELSPVSRRVLVERNLIAPQFGPTGSGRFCIAADESYAVSLNDRDHLRVSAMQPGLNLEPVQTVCSRIEQLLDAKLRFAAALDWGYLTADLTDAGTGQRVSVLLHLPALEAGGELKRVVRETGGTEIRFQAFPLAHGDSLGSVYLVSNRDGITLDEQQSVEKVEDCAATLVHYERSERERLVRIRGDEVRDGVARALEIVTRSQRLSDTEMFQVLSWLRLGVAVGLYDETRLENVTALYFLGQRAHVMRQAGLDDDEDIERVNEQRAQLLRAAFGINR